MADIMSYVWGSTHYFLLTNFCTCWSRLTQKNNVLAENMWIVLEITKKKKKAVTALRCFKCLCAAFFVFEAVLVKFTVICQSFSALALVSWCQSKMHTHVSETGRQTEIAFWQPPLQTHSESSGLLYWLSSSLQVWAVMHV